MTTRKTYDLPAPTNRTRCGTYSAWHTGHSIEIEGDIDNDGVVFLNRIRGNICIETHDNDVLALGYDEAERVALAVLAAVKEAKRARDKEMGK